MTNKINEMANIIRELKEYDEMQKALKAEMDKLKAECIEYMASEGVDEIVTDEGKVTYREVLSKRFDTTNFKKEYLKLYEDYTKMTSAMRFTLN